MIRYLGNDDDGLSHFLKYLNGCLGQYQPGMNLNPVKDIKITLDDSINLKFLSEFIVDTFFKYYFNDEITISSAKFSSLSKSDAHPFKSIEHKQSPLIYAFMYYYDNPQAEPVVITHKHNSYNNQKYEFSPYSGEDGKDLDFGFDPSLKGLNSSTYRAAEANLDPQSKSTLFKNWSNNLSKFYASFNFGLLKLDEGIYMLSLLFAAKDSEYSTEYKPIKTQKVTVKVIK